MGIYLTKVRRTGLSNDIEKGSEHRTDERLSVQWDAEIIIDDKTFSAKISNVSLAGTLALTEAPVELNTELVLKIPNLGEFAGIAVWVDSPYYGLALMVGPNLDLKRFAMAEGGELSVEPIGSSGDDWI